MSQNQTRVEKKEKQYRKTGGGGKPNNISSDHLQRSFSATGRGASPAPPSLSSTHSASNTRSFKKSNNGQGGQTRGITGYVNTTSGPNPAVSGVHPVENGNHVHATVHGVSSPPGAAAVPKSADTSGPKSSQSTTKAQTSQSSSMNSNPTSSLTPSKGEAGKGFPLQFGTISPGFMNCIQVPARTSSAPPDLDEQMRDQVQGAAARAGPVIPVPSTPQQQMPEKHVSSEQPLSQETHTVSKISRDMQVTSPPSPSQPIQAQKPAVLPMAGMSIPMPYHQHQPPVPMQFGGPNPQIQTQGTPNNSLQLPMQMPMHMGNPPQVQQQVFVPGLQHHLMQNQGILHQGQSFGFNPQLGPQLPQQPGNIGMTMSPQFNLKQPGNVGSARKTVKITHPETHEELRLDKRDSGSPKSRAHHMMPQPQTVPSYRTMHPSGYYSNSYSPGPPFFPVPNSLSLISSQLTANSQPPRFNYPISPPTMPYMNQSSNSVPNGKGAAPIHESPEMSSDLVQSVHSLLPSVHPCSPQANVKTAVDSSAEKGLEKAESPRLVRLALDPGVVRKDMDANTEDSSLQSKSDYGCLRKPVQSGPIHTDVIKKEHVVRSDPIRDVEKKSGVKEFFQSLEQVDSNVLQDHGDSKVATLGKTEAATSNVPLVHGKGVSMLESLVSTSAGSASVPAPELGVENIAGKDHHATQNGRILQATEQQAGKEVEELQSGGFEASLRKFESAVSGAEGDKAALQIFPPEKESISMSDNEAASSGNLSDMNIGQGMEIIEKARLTSSSGIVSNSYKSTLDPNKSKNNKGKKKRKEMLQKADALGTTSDLYMAYKGPEEKKETVVVGDGPSRNNVKVSSDPGVENSLRKKKDEQSRLELEDWEDAADVSTPKLEPTLRGGSHHDEEGALVKKYSRDFLLTFSEQCTDLPEDFQITPDIVDILSGFNANASRIDRDYGSSGRMIDGSIGAARHDWRVNGMVDVDRWNKTGPHFPGRDPGMDLAYGSNMMGSRSGPWPNGVLRNPRGQGSIQHVGGILSGPMHSMGFQGMQRNNPEADRWQRATSFKPGLMSPPQTTSQVIHRAENKYEVGKVSDEEQVKQRRLKAILNKLTPQNFEKLFEQVKEVNIDNAITLTGVISQIFDKALMEPTFCEMYANFCQHLASELPDLSVEDEKITFKRLLLNKCQEEFERGEREEEEVNKADGDSELKQTEEEREGKRLKVRRRMLGNIRLIGELYKKRMLTERIMHECIKKLLGQYQNADEENIEALCKLMSTIGEMIDHPKAKEHMDAYFDIMGQLSNNMKLSSRVRFMLKDAIDLRKNKWQERRKVEGPKKIEEVHRDAAQERLGQAGRLSRGPSINSGMRRGQPVEYGPRGSMLPSPVGQMNGFRGLGTQVRGYGGQDARMDERNICESRTLSVPLPQRTSGDEPITLGPQGGLAKGMSCRGQSSGSIAPPTDITFHGDSKRVVSGLNGFKSPSDRGSREDHFSRQASERFGAPVAYDHTGGQQINSIHMNRDVRNSDGNMDKSMLTSSLVARAVAAPAESIASEKVWPEEHLRDMSLAAIKEYYSANDEREVALCIKDLNAPKFYPYVISMWVLDAFERKHIERDMLAKLLVNLTRPQDGMFNPQQLIEGFESVLTNLEDTITDAPKAPEFLGRIFGKVILENVLSFKEVSNLIHKGGEEPGRLLEIGLAADVLGSVLEMIKSEKGDSALNEIRTSSSLRFEDFRPPDPLKSKKLEMFTI